MKRIALTRLAEKDLDSIWEFIASDNPQAADRLLDAVEKVFEKLAKNPRMGHVRNDLADRRHRFFSVLSYLVVYWIEADSLRIIRVLHASRDVHSILDTHIESS